MKTLIGKAALAATLAASTLVVSAPAEARGYHHRGGGDAAIAIGAGIIGLAIGAAIASDNDDDRYYDRGYYHDGYPQYRGGYYYRSIRNTIGTTGAITAATIRVTATDTMAGAVGNAGATAMAGAAADLA
jgi:hypothetical protein